MNIARLLATITFFSTAVLAQQALAPGLAAYQALRTAGSSGGSVPVENLSIRRDVATFTFRSGTIHFLDPVNGKITGAVFSGEGKLTIDPVLEREKDSLKLLTKGEPYRETFNELVLRFTDNTEAEIRAGAKNVTSTPVRSAILDEIRSTLRKTLNSNLDIRLLQDVLSSKTGRAFYAFVRGNRFSGKTLFALDPRGVLSISPLDWAGVLTNLDVRPEEVALYTYQEGKAGVWFAEHLEQELRNGNAHGAEENGFIDVLHHKIDAEIAKSGFLNGTSETTLVSRVDGLRVVPFDFFRTLRVQKVKDAEGNELPFVQEKFDEDPDYAVILPKEVNRGEKIVITTEYQEANRDPERHLAVSAEGTGNYFPVARHNWYPNSEFGDHATYEMRFKVPKGLKMVATGALVSEVEEGPYNISVWKAEKPQTVAGFNFGNFKRQEGKSTTQEYSLEAYANAEQPDVVKSITNRYSSLVGSMSTVPMMKKAMAEAQLAMDIFSTYYGPLDRKTLFMTQQTAGNFGQAWPGLVYLPITYFFDNTVRHWLGMENARGYFRVVGPHEVAHQWWGHEVSWKSYRDQWISEGFAEMSAGLFVQAVFNEKGTKDYFDFLDDERELMTLKNKEGKRAIDAGPLTLGLRLSNSRSGFDIYRRLIYPKGAYVLHMLRMMMYSSFAQDGDERFKRMMQDFVTTHRGKPASTEDFKAIVEKHMSPDMDLDKDHKMDWFFNGYVYGTEYPNYKFQHQFEIGANGEQVLSFSLTQSNVNDSFKMSVPIYIELKNGRIIKLGSVGMAGNTTNTTKVPLNSLKERPKRAMIAYYRDVLAEIENK